PTPPTPPGQNPREWAELFHDAYCDPLLDKVNALEDTAVDALSHCLGKSTELSVYSEWSALCEAELNQMRPGSFPLTTEIRADASYPSPRIGAPERVLAASMK